MCQSCISIQPTDAFAEKVVEYATGGAIAMMISIGHRTGLFDALSELPSATSEELALAAGLNERYVREWLGAMVTGGIVDYDPGLAKYALPEEHAGALTRAAAPNNIAVMTQFISVLGSVEDDIVECFHNGGGVPYEGYKRFHPVMADESEQTVASALEEYILPLAPGLRERLVEGIDVIDFGCGSGRAIIHLARLFPKSTFLGIDLSEDAIKAARESAVDIPNVRFEVQDAASFDRPAAFDLVTAFDIVHDQAQPDVVLRRMRGCLKPHGVLLMQDIKMRTPLELNRDNPLAPFIYTISCMHCMSVSLAQNGLGLGAAWGRELAEQMLGEAGFEEVITHELEHDPMNYFFVSRIAA